MAIVINSTTGEIDLDATTPAIYEVTYTVDGVSSTQEVTVNALDNAAFSYSASSYEPTDADPTPTITGLTGGTFSGTTGLVINSTTGETEVLERVLPLVKKYDAAVVAISNDETGISEDPNERFKVAKKIVEHAADYGIKPQDVVVDPLVMPIGAISQAGNQVFELVRKLRSELKVNTTCGASNVSFGLPQRNGINNAFLPMLIAAGMTSAIVNPLHPELVQAIRAGDVLTGVDEGCTTWISSYKEPAKEGDNPRGERRRRRRA